MRSELHFSHSVFLSVYSVSLASWPLCAALMTFWSGLKSESLDLMARIDSMAVSMCSLTTGVSSCAIEVGTVRSASVSTSNRLSTLCCNA